MPCKGQQQKQFVFFCFFLLKRQTYLKFFFKLCEFKIQDFQHMFQFPSFLCLQLHFIPQLLFVPHRNVQISTQWAVPHYALFWVYFNYCTHLCITGKKKKKKITMPFVILKNNHATFSYFLFCTDSVSLCKLTFTMKEEMCSSFHDRKRDIQLVFGNCTCINIGIS